MDENTIKEKILDEWELELKKQKKLLEAHMKELGINSEMDCPNFPHCPIQEAYVKAVYNSMSKGAGGGFEF
ncbi:MAG: Unknown protein [uncultured Sulfurovum sp.]|uniref:Uncharacterized protein n=1 Tax=uncultured Sulfurovum sp. TaxID=269237 RepID=A0A6S6TRD9_9BACT|nr:MAG: Unknown protein [uncultured Sulfurovum sp.]